MIFTATTYAEAKALLDRARKAYAGQDWSVRLHMPLFAGDLFRVTVTI